MNPFSQSLRELTVNDVPTTLQASIEHLAENWHQLDNEYLLPLVKSKTTRGNLAIPQNFDHINLPQSTEDLNHERVPEEQKDEYFEKLCNIFRNVPKCSALNKEIADCPLAINQYAKDKALVAKDLQHFVEFEVNTNISSTKPKGLLPTVIIDETVFTFHIYHPENYNLHQVIQLLGKHSLGDLQRAIYCVRDKLPTPSTPSPTAFFFMENTFYITGGMEENVEETKPSWRRIKDWLDQRKDHRTIPHNNTSNTAALVPTTVTNTTAIVTKKRRSPADSAALAASLLSQLLPPPSTMLPPLEANITSVDLVTNSTATKKRKKSSSVAASSSSSNHQTVPPASLPAVIPVSSTTSSSSSMCKIAEMEHTTLTTAALRCGEKYLFCHHGYCEHIVILTDIHAYHPVVDEVDIHNFPREIYRTSFRVRKCFVCNVLSADYIVLEDRLAETSPCLYCRECYILLHYDANGNLLYDDFEVYPYLHDT